MKKATPILLAFLLLAAASALGTSRGAQPAPSPDGGAALDAIALPAHALILAMEENDLAYDAQDDGFVWTTMYYAMTLCAQADPRAAYEGDALLLPAESAGDLFAALFASRDALPAIPDALTGRIAYDPTRDEYRLAPGDPALTEIGLDAPTRRADGTLTASGRLTAADGCGMVCAFTLTLEANDGMFGYGILAAEIGQEG